MPLPSLNVPEILRRYGLRPHKGLGQNFLMDESALRKVVSAAEISEGDVILEVGPGLGSLTRHLAEVAQQVIAVELDASLLPPLQEVLSAYDNVTVIQGDILNLDPKELFPQSVYKVVANIPYYITSALIRHLLESEKQPLALALTVQKEVAQRICADPPDMSLLALSVQVYGDPHIAARIPAGAFYPAPKVDSAVVKIDLLPHPLIPSSHMDTFFRLAKAGFGQKRKMLRNTISVGMAWPKEKAERLLNGAGIDPKRRAQTLSLKEWEQLTLLAQNENAPE